MNTETKARAAYDAALTAADEWRQTIAQLERDLDATNAETPNTPADLAKIADRQVSLAKQLEMARAQLVAREAAVVDAGRGVVASQADDLQPDIVKARKQVDVIDATTADLRAAVDAHLQATREARQQAEAELLDLGRLQGGLRAAVAGDGVREYFRTLADLPASLHPQTGILPQVSYLTDIEQIEYHDQQARRQEALNALAAKLDVYDGLDIALSDYDRPSEEWAAEARAALAAAGPDEAQNRLAVFDEAHGFDADAASLSRLAKHLVNPQAARSHAKAITDHFAKIADEAASLAKFADEAAGVA